MTLLRPWMLAALLVLPLLVAGYRRLVARRAARRAELAALGLVGSGGAAAGRWRHVAPALMLLALALLLFSLAGPQATVAQPRRQGTVVLAFDVSSSMGADDLTPTRMDAAKAAARTFVQRQPDSIRIAVVAFGENGVITQQPTTDRGAVLAAVDRMAPQGGTALGRGIQASLSAIAGHTIQLEGGAGGGAGGSADSLEPLGPKIGYYGSAAVVLLSDGENTSGPDPVAAAQLASTAGVKIYPVGLGSAAGSVLRIDGFQVATALDEPVLRQIASTTDGQYFNAADGPALQRIYSSIDLSWTVESHRIEITALFAGAAALLLLIGAGLSFVWFGRVV